VLTNSNELLGQELGTCTIQRLIGRGGMGAVYLAQQSRPRRTVAVKVLLPGIVMEERSRDEFLARFRREADAIAALDHVNIMPVYEYGEQEDIAYLVMPYVMGGTLRERLTKRGILPLEETITIMEQAAAALDSAHAQGIIHRDLKPGNILFHADGRVLLADFGLAKVLRDEGESDSGLSVLTSAGTIVGTPEYLSPEQGTGNTLDYRTDVYSLGVVLYQMLAGRVPFTGTSPVAIAIKHAMEEPPLLTQFNPGISRSVEAVVMKALAKAPEQRFASAGELARALRDAAFNEQSTHLWLSTNSGETKPGEMGNQDTIPEGMVAEPEPTPVTAQPDETAQERVDTLPVMLTPSNEDDIHGSATEETPRLPTHAEKIATHSTIIAQADVTPVTPPRKQVHKKAAQRSRPVTLAQQEQLAERPLEQAPVHIHQQPRLRAGCQSMSMMLIGSLLTLVLLAGGFAAYLHLLPTPKTTQPITAHKTKTPASTQPAQPQPTSPPAVLPNPAVPAAGALIYGTALPSSCDKQGGHWSTTPDAKITCSTTATELINTGSTPNHSAGTFLDSMPGKQMPDNFVLQVQIDMNAGSHGQFGLFFRNQPGTQPQGAYSFILDSAANTDSFYVYDNTTGTASPLFSSLPLQTKMSDLVTIDIVVRGSNFSFYVNGTDAGHGESSHYQGGTIGLAAYPGADVTFKNLALYTLS